MPETAQAEGQKVHQPAAFVHTTETIRTIYLDGRSDDQLNILGEKTNACEIKKRLLQVSNIEECEISVEEKKSEIIIVAHISGKNLPSSLPNSVFDGIPPVFIPQKYIHHEKLPRNESGKICLR